MNHTVLILLLAFISLLVACQNTPQQKARQNANAIQEAMKKYGPPEVATSAGGYMMKAVIDGKPWTAKSMMEINPSNNEYIHGDDGNTQISFYIDRDHISVNKPRKFYTGHSADLSSGDNLMSAKSGEWIITKADDKVIEGTFHFSASSAATGKKSEVTKGSFRILLNHKKS